MDCVIFNQLWYSLMPLSFQSPKRGLGINLTQKIFLLPGSVLFTNVKVATGVQGLEFCIREYVTFELIEEVWSSAIIKDLNEIVSREWKNDVIGIVYL